MTSPLAHKTVVSNMVTTVNNRVTAINEKLTELQAREAAVTAREASVAAREATINAREEKIVEKGMSVAAAVDAGMVSEAALAKMTEREAEFRVFLCEGDPDSHAEFEERGYQVVLREWAEQIMEEGEKVEEKVLEGVKRSRRASV